MPHEGRRLRQWAANFNPLFGVSKIKKDRSLFVFQMTSNRGGYVSGLLLLLGGVGLDKISKILNKNGVIQ